jgi:hypothetical protein
LRDVLKYLRGFVWSSSVDNDFFSPTARYTLSDPPLPRPPPEEFDTDAMTIIRNHPHLFHATSPINVDAFEHVLASHPNRPFVQSVCVSLREGFWGPHSEGDLSANMGPFFSSSKNGRRSRVFERAERFRDCSWSVLEVLWERSYARDVQYADPRSPKT